MILIGALDYITESDLQLDFFTLLPLFVVTWLARREAAIATAITVTLAWVLIDKLTGHMFASWTVDAWNTGIKLALFLAFVELLLVLKRDFRTVASVGGFVELG